MINLMIVEDNDVVRDGLVKFFSYEHDIRIASTAADGYTAMSILKEHATIDIVLVDWNMPDMDGLQLTYQITSQFPSVKVIILTMHSKQEYKEKAKAAGAKGYLLKDGDFDDLIRAVRHIASGNTLYQ